ncbi:MAG: CheR family methyltransferase [Pseudomonadota bacterium]
MDASQTGPQIPYVVAVGASAGGVTPLKEFFRSVSKTSMAQPAFVVIQHLADDHISMMPDILQRETALPVLTVSENLPLEASTIYLIPAGANIELRKARKGLVFGLIGRATRPDVNLPIDIFFNSMANLLRERSIAVILSGAGSDGSMGLTAVKGVGGLVIVQDPSTAEFESMPQSALDSGRVDYIFPVNEIPLEIENFIRRSSANGRTLEAALEEDIEGVTNLLTVIGASNPEWQVRFAGYKRPMVCRRIAKRMLLSRCATLADYVTLVREHKAEAEQLANELLVSVTEFFRDPEAWKEIADHVIPDLLSDQGPEAKIWSAGCCTGEEAYSLAILCDEYCRKNDLPRNFKIVATDLDSAALEVASAGVYPRTIADQIAPDRLQRYFRVHKDGYEILATLRSKVLFSRHDLIDSPPFVYVDLLVCRNVLIYLDGGMQERLLDNFNFSLRRDGYLFLGPSESLGNRHGAFRVVNRVHRIFANLKRQLYRTPGQIASFPTLRSYMIPTAPRVSRRSMQTVKERAMLTAAMQDFPQSCVIVVDEDWKVLDSAGQFKRFLRIADEGFSADLLSMVPNRAAVSLGLCLRKLLPDHESQETLTRTRIPYESDLGSGFADVSMRLLEAEDDYPGYSIVLVFRADDGAEVSEGGSSGRVQRTAVNDKYVEELEQELADTQEFLKSTITELESSNGELQTTNEELLSSNEELQSTYEEMQSVNEELVTVNAEFQVKNEELLSLNADVNSLLESSEVATIWLDRQASIRKFTPKVEEIFNLELSDQGRPLAHFTPSLNPEASSKLENAIESVASGDIESAEFEGRTKQGVWFSIRVVPFFNVEHDLGGAVINFVDIDALKKSQRELEDRSVILESILENTMAGFWDWYPEDDYEYMSPGFKAMFGYADHEMPNHPDSWQKIVHPDDLASVFEVFNEHIESRGAVPYDNAVRYFHKDGSIIWVLCRGKVVEWSEDDKPLRMIGSHVDITPLKRAEDALRRYAEDSRQLAYVASHDLREPLNTIRHFADLLLAEHFEDPMSEKAQLVSRMGRAAKNMEALVAGLLDYARLDTADISFDFVSLDETMAEVLDNLDKTIAESGAKIHVNALPAVRGSESLLQQVLMNLVSNALKFRKDDTKPEIRITVDESPTFIALSVSDNGIGISSEHTGKIFELFTRLNTRSDYPGSGIGLALCRRIADLHGGSLDVTSELGRGSHFMLRLPRIEAST